MDEGRKQQLLEKCLRDHYEEILNYMYLRAGNRYDAEDLTQEAFFKMTRAIQTFRQDSTLRTWAFTIAKRTLADAYKQKKKRRNLLDRIKHQLLLRSQPQSNHYEIFEALGILPEEERDLVILKHYFGFSYEELSGLTGLTANHIGVRLSRAIKQIREHSESEVKNGESI